MVPVGAHAALAGNCSNLYIDESRSPSGCCSETSVSQFPWWQYDLGSAMQVGRAVGGKTTGQWWVGVGVPGRDVLGWWGRVEAAI